ncbi:MAG: mismatch-specific DNA-glycosylase [Thermoflavifilum sp.]|nr:mismatch-specific DNA-glycosylase [Thermoflavifilum sp.]MCL6515188.1 mismatch-specific DNA-glycosylase [Alicyclobacillus sp.]
MATRKSQKASLDRFRDGGPGEASDNTQGVWDWVTDVLAPGLRVLFIGFNPSPASYARRANYAGRNNRFYRVLYLAGITPILHQPEDSRRFAELYGFGFTNLSPRPTAKAEELTREELRSGADRVRRLLRELRPGIACYVGKGVYQRVARSTRPVPWGFREGDGVVPGVIDFVGPSTSGLVRMRLEEMVDTYRALGRYLELDNRRDG